MSLVGHILISPPFDGAAPVAGAAPPVTAGERGLEDRETSTPGGVAAAAAATVAGASTWMPPGETRPRRGVLLLFVLLSVLLALLDSDDLHTTRASLPPPVVVFFDEDTAVVGALGLPSLVPLRLGVSRDFSAGLLTVIPTDAGKASEEAVSAVERGLLVVAIGEGCIFPLLLLPPPPPPPPPPSKSPELKPCLTANELRCFFSPRASDEQANEQRKKTIGQGTKQHRERARRRH